MRHKFVMRKVIGRALYTSAMKSARQYVVEVLECGHKGRPDWLVERDCHETARALGRVGHILAGTAPKRRCHRCPDNKPADFDLKTVELMPWDGTDDRAKWAVRAFGA